MTERHLTLSTIDDLSAYCPHWTPTRPRFSFCSSPPDRDVITLLLGQYPWTRFLLRYSNTFLDDVASFLIPLSVDHGYHEHCPVSVLFSSLMFHHRHCLLSGSSIYTCPCIPTSSFFLFLTFLLRTHKASTPVTLPHHP